MIHLSDITSALHLTPPLFIPQVQEEAEEEQESLKALLSAAVAKLSLVSAVHCIELCWLCILYVCALCLFVWVYVYLRGMVRLFSIAVLFDTEIFYLYIEALVKPL